MKNVLSVWWLNPFSIVALFIVPLILITYYLPQSSYGFFYNSYKYVDLNELLILIGSVFFFCIGILFAFISFKPLKTNNTFGIYLNENKKIIFLITNTLFFFCLLGYSIWFLNYLRLNSFIHIIELFKGTEGAIYQVKENIGRISGITSLTQLGPTVIILLLLSYSIKDNKRNLIIMILTLLFLSLVRAIVFTERLALLEILIPMVIGIIYIIPKDKIRKKTINILPVVLVLFVILFYGVGEYFRSWLNYYSQVSDSFLEFILVRISGYYVNAINTGVMFSEKIGQLPIPYYSIRWFWELPFNEGLYEKLTGVNPTVELRYALNLYTNPEFNNPGGLSLFYHDFGLIAGSLIWIILGILTGLIYILFIKRYLLGLFLYPIWFIGLLELPRYLYWTNARFLPSLFTVILIVIIIPFLAKYKKIN